MRENASDFYVTVPLMEYIPSCYGRYLYCGSGLVVRIPLFYSSITNDGVFT